MRGITTLTIDRDDMKEAITFWLNNQMMKHPCKCIGFQASDSTRIVEIEIEPIQPDGSPLIHPKGSKEYNLWLEQHGGD